ncbi:hypothetical protein EV44_g6461 [Erysiphe necator]|uniref:Uncharacterized protein n=1 Tax=Uncinula necator TaxID=52586 RepID=A0A0B1PE48_UNCNE|nr:hypothetical protein EV44_g6461 [Erysiphe necator]
MKLSLESRNMKAVLRVIQDEVNRPNANMHKTRLVARSELADKPRSNSSLTLKGVAMFLTRRNKSLISRSSHNLSARQGDSKEDAKEDDQESSDPKNEKSIGSEAKLSSPSVKDSVVANASDQKSSSEKTNVDHQKENGSKFSLESEKPLHNTSSSVSGSQKPSNTTASLGSDVQKPSNNKGVLLSEGQKASNSTTNSGSKGSKPPNDTGKPTPDGNTTGAKTNTENQKEKENNQKPDTSKEKNQDSSKPANEDSKPPATGANQKTENGQNASNKDAKNTSTPTPVPKNEKTPPNNPKESAITDSKGADTPTNSLPTIGKVEQNQPSSASNGVNKSDENKSSDLSLGSNPPPENKDQGATKSPDNGPNSEKVEDVQSSSLTASAKASLGSEVPKISAKQSSNDSSHADVVKLIASIFGALLLLTIVVYIIRLCLRYRRIGKAESPPPSPLINRMDSMPRGAHNYSTLDRGMNNNYNNFYPFHEEERLRTIDMNKTYGRVI